MRNMRKCLLPILILICFLVFLREILNAEVNIEQNPVPKESIHSNDLTLTDERTDEYSPSTPRVNVEVEQTVTSGQVKGGTSFLNLNLRACRYLLMKMLRGATHSRSICSAGPRSNT